MESIPIMAFPRLISLTRLQRPHRAVAGCVSCGGKDTSHAKDVKRFVDFDWFCGLHTTCGALFLVRAAQQVRGYEHSQRVFRWPCDDMLCGDPLNHS